MNRFDALHALDEAKFSRAHIRAMCVAGSGFLVDSYDNFIIGLMVPMIAYEQFHEPSLPSKSEGWVKAMSSYGNVVGQLAFAILGDVLGRKRVYGLELLVLIGGALLCAFATWPIGGDANNLLLLLGGFRFLLGIGVGGDYPVSAVITSEFASTRNRGTMIATVFAMQGFGILLGAFMAVAILALLKQRILDEGEDALGYCWRFLAGFGAIPALLAVYWRLRIPETPRFAMDVLKDMDGGARAAEQFLDGQVDRRNWKYQQRGGVYDDYSVTFRSYFSKWVNLKVLLGCAGAWFFLDIGYYGTTLNTPVVLDIIGYGEPGPESTGNQRIYDDLWLRSVGAAIIAMAGTVPGYWFTVFFVDKWGRKPIQFMGFALLTALFLVMALFLPQLQHAQTTLLVVLYSAAQFFFNFGPNATTFIIPAEVFATQVRSTGHGISAAAGKVGAILAAQGFDALAKGSFGFQGVLYIFTGCCALGFLCTFWVPETMNLSLEQLSSVEEAKRAEFASQQPEPDAPMFQPGGSQMQMQMPMLETTFAFQRTETPTQNPSRALV